MSTINWRNNRVYVNETVFLMELVEGTLEIKRKMREITSMGLLAPAKLPTGKFEPLVAKLKINSIAPAQIKLLIANDYYLNIRMIGECRALDGALGQVVSDSLTTVIRGHAEELPLPGVMEDKQEHDITVNLLFISLVAKSGPILTIDLPNGIIDPPTLG